MNENTPPEQTVEAGWQYARNVVGGKIPACDLLKKSCQRTLDWLDGPPEGGYYDVEAAQHVIDFFGFLTHLKGPLAGQPLALAEWQLWIISVIYGFMRADGRRMIRTVYIEVPRKQGKSTLCSGLSLYHVLADGEETAEVYAAATTRDQARIVFNDAQRMVVKSPLLSKHLKKFRNTVVHEATQSTMLPLSADADTLEGLSPSFSVVDELHVHKTPEVWDVINVASGARAQPLIFGITTAGTNKDGICYDQRDYVVKLVKGLVDDSTYFGAIWTIDSDDDWRDPASWIKANPGYGISVFPDDLERLCKQAMESTSAETNFRTKRLNQWRNASEAWFKSGDWEECQALPKPPIESFVGERCYVGLDLAQVEDIAAVCFLFEKAGVLYPFLRYYLPEEAVQRATGQLGVLYHTWATEGRIILTEGNVTDLSYIEQDLLEQFTKYQIREIAYDAYGATQLSANLIDAGLPMVKHGQGIMAMSDPSKELEKAVVSKTIAPGDDAILAWMAHNCVIYTDPNDNIKVKKETVSNKIDGIIAIIMALSRLRVHGGPEDSVYKSRGIRSL